MKLKLAILLLLAGSTVFAGPRFFFGVGVGNPYYGYGYAPYGYVPPPAPVAAYAPYPGAGYSWVGGYWYPYGSRWAWRAGNWAVPPFRGAAWVGPRYYSGRYYRGYWRR